MANAGPSGFWSRHAPVGICALGLVGLMLWHGNPTKGYLQTSSLFSWWTQQWFEPGAEADHGPLIIVMAVGLFWWNWRRNSPAREHPADGRGIAAVAGAIFLHVIGYLVQQPRVSLAGLFLALWGVAAWSGGRRGARAALFPAGFLLLAVPLNLFDVVGFPLRLAVAHASGALVRLLGHDVVVSGTQLLSGLDGYEYDVAAACAGIRSLAALFAIALVIGYVNFSRMWVRLAMAVLALPLAFLANVVRVTIIVVVSEAMGRSAGLKVHQYSGPFVFVVCVGVVLAVASWAERRGWGAASPDDSAKGPPAAPQRVREWQAAAGLLVILAGAGLLLKWADRRAVEPVAGVKLDSAGANPTELPRFIGSDWVGKTVPIAEVERATLPPDTGYSRRLYVSMEDPQKAVFLSLVLTGRDRSSIHRPEVCLLGQGWTVDERGERTVDVGGHPLTVTLLTIHRFALTGNGKWLPQRSLLVYFFVGRDATEASYGSMMWRGMCDRLFRLRVNRWAYVVAQCPLEGDASESFKRLSEILSRTSKDWLMVADR